MGRRQNGGSAKKDRGKARYTAGIPLAVRAPTITGAGTPMLVTMLRISVGLLLWLSVCTHAASPNVAFFYGSNPPWDELKAFDVVVVEPDHAIGAAQYSSPETQVFAYVSVGEVERERPYAKELPAAWIPGANEAWNSVVIDQTRDERHSSL